MQRWIWILASLASPCFAATLTGTITDENGLAIYKARVLVFHDLSLVMSQRKITDFNGLYHIDLDPGPYRMFVLREGFQPIFAAILILHEAEQVKVDLKLTPKAALASNREDPRTNREDRTKGIKEVLRGSNLEPMHSESIMTLAIASPSPREELAFAGQLRSGSRRDLSGDMEQTRSLEVQTRLSSGVSLTSTMTSEKNELGSDATQYGAIMDLSLPLADIVLTAESRRREDAPEVTSDAASLKSSYGDAIAMTTNVNLSSQRGQNRDQRYLAATQEVRYEWGGQQLAHDLNVADWRDKNASYANRTHVGTRWQYANLPWLTLATSYDTLEAGSYRNDYSETWVQLQNSGEHAANSYSSELGFQDHSDGSAFVQRHHFGTLLGPIAVDTRYADERNYLSLTGADIFGGYLPSTEPALAHEGFVAIHSRNLSVELGYDPGQTYKASLQWKRKHDTGQVLYNQRTYFFHDRATHQENRFIFALNARDDSAGLSYTYSESQNDYANFVLQALSYRQMFSPFRNKTVGLQLELSLKDNPDVPAWWLLEQLPWQDGGGNWYEGHLALQF